MKFRREILKMCIAQMCVNHGWEFGTPDALETLTNILETYFVTVAQSTHLAAELSANCEPSFQDLLVSLNNLGINVAELSEYIFVADHTSLQNTVSCFPASRCKTITKSALKTLQGGDNQISMDKKQPGNESLSPIKSARAVPEEAEASQYEMKSLTLTSLESGDFTPTVEGRQPSSKINKMFLRDDDLYKSSKPLVRGSTPNVINTTSMSDVKKEKVEGGRIKLPKQPPVSNNENVPQHKLKKQFEQQPTMTVAGLKKHRKPSIKEAFIAKKKQSKSAKLASSIVKVDTSDACYGVGSQVRKKRPGRKPKKPPKSRIFVSDAEEMRPESPYVCVETPANDALMEVVNNVVEESLVIKEKDVMMDDDMELGAVNDEMLVEIADRGGDSPLAHLTGMVPIQGNKELFNNREMFGESKLTRDSNGIESNVNIDVEEEILPWSDEEVLKSSKSDHPHRATGLELILRGREEGSASTPKKNNEMNGCKYHDKEKRKEKKLKKLKKNFKQEVKGKLKKGRTSFRDDELRTNVVESHLSLAEPVETFNGNVSESYFVDKIEKYEEPEDSFKQNNKKLLEDCDWNDLGNEELIPKKKRLSIVQPQIDVESLEFAKKIEEVPTDVLHKKKKKKGKRKLDDIGEIDTTPKPKKFKKESFEGPTIPKLTLKFAGATVCGGDGSSPSTKRDHNNEPPVRHVSPPPIKLVIKPISNPYPPQGGMETGRHHHSPTEECRRKSRSPSPSRVPRFSPSPDRLSIPSVAMSSRSPSPNDMARLASGPSNRKNLSPIYSESPSPPHVDYPNASRNSNMKKSSHTHSKTKFKEPKPISIKPIQVPKSAVNKPSKSAIISETVGKITKANGEIIWICPTCGCPDSGTPMIGCDRCDDWYHWVCVNIVKEPPAETNWYCVRCLNQNPSLKSQMPNKRGRPAGKGKSKK